MQCSEQAAIPNCVCNCFSALGPRNTSFSGQESCMIDGHPWVAKSWYKDRHWTCEKTFFWKKLNLSSKAEEFTEITPTNLCSLKVPQYAPRCLFLQLILYYQQIHLFHMKCRYVSTSCFFTGPWGGWIRTCEPFKTFLSPFLFKAKCLGVHLPGEGLKSWELDIKCEHFTLQGSPVLSSPLFGGLHAGSGVYAKIVSQPLLPI